MAVRFYNARILSLENGMNVDFGEVHTDGGVISYVGDSENAPKGSFEREINLNGNLIMPSFKNAHTHSAMTFLRSYADDLPLQDWLFKQVFPMEAKLTGDDIYNFSAIAFAEYLTSGITADFDMYFEPEYMAEVSEDIGFRTVMCGSVAGSEDECDFALNKLETLYNKYKDRSEFVSYRLGFHAEYTTHVSIINGIGELAKKYKAPVYTHNSETLSETKECIERHGYTPTELMERAGVFEYGGGGFHCVYMSDNDMEIFRRRGLWAVTNPCSNAKLASGIAPLAKMTEKGIKLAIGTDGAASNNALDMFREMYLAAVMQKIQLKDAAAMPADRILRMACCGSANAMGLDSCDGIAKGKKADLIVIDLNAPNMRPLHNIPKNLVYSGSKQNVLLTMCAGKILYENGEFTTIDLEKAYSYADAAIKRMTND